MNKVKVKICGIRSLESAHAAIDAGADFLGFNFVKSSKRYIELEEAKKIINVIARSSILQNDEGTYRMVHPEASPPGEPIAPRNDVLIVGVFQNQSVDEVNTIAEMLNLDFVQLHGKESAEYIEQMTRSVIKRISINSLEQLEKYLVSSIKYKGRIEGNTKYKILNTKYLALDRAIQGQGDMVDLEQAAKIAQAYPIFLAGGLTPENVSSLVKKVKPFAVDVAQGVETDGKEDYAKIYKFIKTAKNIL